MTHLKEIFAQMEIELNDLQEEQFNKYTDLLIDYNKKVNLTSILEPSQINLKHYLDSVLPVHTGCFKDGMKVIDVGCGAGFPSVPLKIYMPSLKFTLLDSLNKRINFLNILSDELNLSEILTVHSRAEDAGHNEEFREKFFIALKGKDGEAELEASKKAMEILNVKLFDTLEFTLPGTDNQRKIYVFKKVSPTPKKYPRQAGKPTKSPL